MNKKLAFLIPACLSMLLAACGGGDKPVSQTTSTTTSQTTSTTTSTTTSSAPADPKEAFRQAKDRTVSSVQYQYDFSLSAKIKFAGAVSFSPATYSGTTYVNTSNEETQFLQQRNISGALVIDSTNYIYNVGTDLVKISADDNKDFSVINHETVESVYDFDKHNFGLILKNLVDADLAKVEFKDSKYVISLHTNFSQDSLLGMLNYIDSKTILKALSAYTKAEWGVSFSVNTWATLNTERTYINKFHFDCSVIIKNVFEIGFEFEQSFTKYSGVAISVPLFPDTSVTPDEVKNELNNFKTVVGQSKNAPTSYYDYNVKTTVDHGVSKGNPLGLAVNSTTKGFARRQIVGNDVFFNNQLLVDSDYKNKDQKGDLVADYDSYRARLNNADKDVYDVLDPKVGFNKYTLLDGYNEDEIDNHYMLPADSLINYDNIKVIKKTTDSKANTTTYKFGLSTDGVKELLKFYNKSIRIDFNRVTIFDIYNIESDFVAKKALLTYTFNNESKKLLDVDIDLKGFYVEKDSGDQVKFRLENEIEYDWTKSYTAATTKEDIDNK